MTNLWQQIPGNKILCSFGFHKWVNADSLRVIKSDLPLRACTRCKRKEEGVYDMARGGTNWYKV